MGHADFKDEIKLSPQIYGMYKFAAVDTGRPGALRFKVELGSGLYSLFQNKQGAIDIARICRVHGRDYEPIRGHIAFWRDGYTPLFDEDIPEKVKFSGKLKPGAKPPANPITKDKTVASPPSE